MALANYTDLVAAVGNWLNRSDLTARIPEFIALAEAEFNRLLRVQDMEGQATATAAASVAVPDDFAGLISIKIGDYELEQVSPAELKAMPDNSGIARYFAIYDGAFNFRATPTAGEVKVVYHAKIPALTSTNTTNWLMTAHPDLYLFATLAQAEFYGWNDERLPLVKARTEEILGQLAWNDIRSKHGNKPLVQGAANVRSIRGVRA